MSSVKFIKVIFLDLIDDILFNLGQKIKSVSETIKQWIIGMQWIVLLEFLPL